MITTKKIVRPRLKKDALAIRLEAIADEPIDTIHGHPTVSKTLRETILNTKAAQFTLKAYIFIEIPQKTDDENFVIGFYYV